MSDCSICCEKFNKSTHSPIECKTCEDQSIKACQSCCKKYILDSVNDPKCMVCKIEWDQEFMHNNFTKTFISKELKAHKENILFERQIARLPESQQDAQKQLLIEGMEKQRNLINKQITELTAQIRKLHIDVQSINRTISEVRFNTPREKNKENNFVFKCPLDCNGYLNKNYQCGICESKICKDCFEKIDETESSSSSNPNSNKHVCNEEKKQTIAFLKRDTKPCPKCSEMIHKTEGCDQMYCIKCHTAFSWRTGEIETNHIHNPEYFRYLRENGQHIPRNPGDIPHNPCAELPNYSRILNICRAYNGYEYCARTRKSLDTSSTIKIVNMYRMKTHIMHLQRINANENENKENKLLDLRVNYILKRLTKEEFKRKIQIINKKFEKDQKVMNVWNLLNLVLNEYLGKVSEIDTTTVNNEAGKEIIKNIVVESKNIIDYANNAFRKIGEAYNVVYCGLTYEWIEISNYQKHLKQKMKASMTNSVN